MNAEVFLPVLNDHVPRVIEKRLMAHMLRISSKVSLNSVTVEFVEVEQKQR